MEEQPKHSSQERATISTRFFNRLHRYKNLVEARWWILALGVVLAGGAEFYLVWNAPLRYKSEATMIVPGKIYLPNGTSYTDDNNANFLGTTLSLLQSESISNQVVNRLHAEKPELAQTRIDFHVTVSPKTEIFSLRTIGTSSNYAQAFLETTMEEFIAVKKAMASTTAKTTDTGLQKEIEKVSSELDIAKVSLANFRSNNPVVLLQDQGNSAAAHLSELTRQREDYQMKLDLLNVLTLDENVDNRIGMADASSGGSVGGSGRTSQPTTARPADPNQQVSTTPAGNNNSDNHSDLVGSQSDYLKAKQHVAILENLRKDWHTVYRDKHPKMKALDEEITRYKSLLDIFGTQINEQLASQKHALKLEIDELSTTITEWESKTLDASKKMADFLAIKESIVRLQGLYDSLQNSARSVQVQQDINPDSVTVFEHATAAKAVPPAIAKHLSLAGLVGLALGIGVLLALDRLDDRPSSYTELEDLFDETILGQIPLATTKDKKAGAPVLQPEDDRHALVEAYRNLRSSIVFMSSPQAHPKTIVLTSAIPGDGKSMTSANLAITIARAGSKILLIDADLRRGVMHKHFSIPNEIGFADVLMEKLHWSKALVKTDVPNLDVIPRGGVPRHPGELFMTKVKEGILKETAEKYDFVLFDTPPVMAADDVSNLAPYVDGVIMVIRANYTSGRVARAALDLLYMRKINVLGLNFNGVRVNAGEYYYYKYKEYYAKYPAASS